MDLIKNRKLKRAADYTFKDEDRVILWTLDANDELDDLVDPGASREVAHKWMHGQESRGEVPATDPTVDEMLDAIATKLKTEMAHYMEWACDDSHAREGMYRASKLTRAVW